MRPRGRRPGRGRADRCSRRRPRQRLADAGEADAPGPPAVSSKPITAHVPAELAGGAACAPSASESLAQTSAVDGSASSSSRAGLGAGVHAVHGCAAAGPALGRGDRRAQPARRSSPTPEPAGQPRKPIRRCPASSRCRVASAVPAAPSTSTQEWRVRRAPRPAEGHERHLPSGEPGGAHVAVVGAGQHKGVQVVRGEQVVVRGDLVGVVVGGVEHHAVAGRRRPPR